MQRQMNSTLLLAAPPPPASNYRPAAMAGYLLIAFCFGGVGSWAAIAKLGSSVQAGGTVSVETQRKVVEHLEGGLVQTINVKEGQSVRAGELLVRFSDTQTLANLNGARDDLFHQKAQEARLLAERDQTSSVKYPKDLLLKAQSDAGVKKAVDNQNALFLDRKQSLDGQVIILTSRAKGLGDELEGLRREEGSARQQLSFIDDELVGVRDLFKKGLVPRARRNALEREEARIDGMVGRDQADEAKAENSVLEMQLQITQLKQRFSEEVASSLQETEQKISDLSNRINVYIDAQNRSDIVAPVSGVVQNLKVSTVGQVFRGGEPLLEIVPLKDGLVVRAHVSPTDIAEIAEHMPAEIKFTSFRSRSTPLILGTVSSLSHDELMDETTHRPYFLARIAISDTDIPQELKGRLRAGMQAEVIFPTGERTVLQYLLHPLDDAFSRTFSEK